MLPSGKISYIPSFFEGLANGLKRLPLKTKDLVFAGFPVQKIRWIKTALYLYGRLVRKSRLHRFTMANINAEPIPNLRTRAAAPAFPPDIPMQPAPESIRTMEKCMEGIRALRTDQEATRAFSMQLDSSANTRFECLENHLDGLKDNMALFGKQQAKMNDVIAKRTFNYKNLTSALGNFEKKLDLKFELTDGEIEKSRLSATQYVKALSHQTSRDLYSHGKKLDVLNNQFYICDMRMSVAEAKLIAYEGRIINGENRLNAIEKRMHDFDGRMNRISNDARVASATVTTVLDRLAVIEQGCMLANGRH